MSQRQSGLCSAAVLFTSASLIGACTSFTASDVPPGAPGDAGLDADDSRSDAPVTLADAGDGLHATYRTSADALNGPIAFERVDPEVDFDWGTGSPGVGVADDNFSVRWTGQVEPQYTEQYTFYLTNDDGAVLVLEKQPVVDNTREAGSPPSGFAEGKIQLDARRLYRIEVLYFESRGTASVKLEWSSPSQQRQVIPRARLYSQ